MPKRRESKINTENRMGNLDNMADLTLGSEFYIDILCKYLPVKYADATSGCL